MKTEKTTVQDSMKECPECGSALNTCWVKDRKLRKECANRNNFDGDDDCGWVGEPYVPPKKRVSLTKDAFTVSGCWEYEVFDKYGHTSAISQGFSSEAACRSAAKKKSIESMP